MKHLVAYLGAAATFAVLDAIWLTVAGSRLYRPALAPLLADGFRLAPAIAFYVLYVAGIVIFAVAPAMRTGQWTTAALMGGLFGFFCYATYDLTNQATLKLWPLKVTLIDISWGTVLTATSATVAWLVVRRFT